MDKLPFSAEKIREKAIPPKAGPIVLAAALIGVLVLAGSAAQEKDAFQSSFPVDKAKLADSGTSAYFRLEPGYRLFYADGKNTLTITVLDETKMVDGVKTRIVEERETENGQVIEISRNFFALDSASGDVYYFGEDVDIYKDGKIANHEGAWLSGIGGDRLGLFLPGRPAVGRKYYQEFAKNAKDRAEIISLSEEVKTPAGVFKRCLHLRDSSALESGGGDKWFAPGVGMVRDEGFVLIKIEKPAAAR